jgi:hypothetical protein
MVLISVGILCRWRIDLLCCRLHNLYEALGPGFKCFSFFGIVAVPIVDGSDFPLNVIQDFFYRQTRDSQSRHQTGGGTPEIMANEIDLCGSLDPLQSFLWVADMRIALGTWKNEPRLISFL